MDEIENLGHNDILYVARFFRRCGGKVVRRNQSNIRRRLHFASVRLRGVHTLVVRLVHVLVHVVWNGVAHAVYEALVLLDVHWPVSVVVFVVWVVVELALLCFCEECVEFARVDLD